MKRIDLCHLGFWLGLGAHLCEDDARLPLLGEAVLSAQCEDGGWNCHLRNYPDPVHSSFHTTFNVLENLRIASQRGIVPKRSFAAAERRAVELLLEHRPIDLLRGKRKPNGRWPLQTRTPGTLLVEMEKPGQDSRWNTLRALRVLRSREEPSAGGLRRR